MADTPKKNNRSGSWKKYSSSEIGNTKGFLMDMVTSCKTERECIRWLKSDLSTRGAGPIQDRDSLAPGDVVFMNWKGRAILAAKIGKLGLGSGVTVIASHVDSPRIDLKGRPLYEEGGLALLDCHYYGGLKKYQWTNVPLALHGEIHRTDGTSLTVVLGEREDEPILMIPDLEPHVDRDMGKRKASETIDGENMDALAGNRPYEEGELPVKEAISRLLQEKWGLDEKGFLSADLSLVPSGPARLAGLDGSMIAAYGLDDRVCTSMSYKAFRDMDLPDRTAVFMAVDREEIGSESVGGAQGAFMDLFMLELLRASGHRTDVLSLRKLYGDSVAISADVTSGMNPLYSKNYVRDQQPLVGNGVAVVKFSGWGGKYEGNEARGEFVASIVASLEKKSVPWQTGSFGRVDKAGGGTIAKYLARTGMDTIDMGPPLLSMHSPMELISSADVTSLYHAYMAIWEYLPIQD